MKTVKSTKIADYKTKHIVFNTETRDVECFTTTELINIINEDHCFTEFRLVDSMETLENLIVNGKG